jgi:hypothetical protein
VPEVPVIVAVDVPAVAVLLAVSVSPLVVVAVAGLKAAVTPLGRPEAVRATLPVKPFFGVIVSALEPLAPCATVTLVGDAARPKSGTAATAGVSVDIPVENKLLLLSELVFSPVK